MPDTSKKILEQINNNCKDMGYDPDNSYELTTPYPLFARIDVKK